LATAETPSTSFGFSDQEVDESFGLVLARGEDLFREQASDTDDWPRDKPPTSARDSSVGASAPSRQSTAAASDLAHDSCSISVTGSPAASASFTRLLSSVRDYGSGEDEWRDEDYYNPSEVGGGYASVSSPLMMPAPIIRRSHFAAQDFDFGA
jgi:hypothetical protein